MTKKTTTTIIVLDEQLYKYVGVMRTIRRRNKEIKRKKNVKMLVTYIRCPDK